MIGLIAVAYSLPFVTEVRILHPFISFIYIPDSAETDPPSEQFSILFMTKLMKPVYEKRT